MRGDHIYVQRTGYTHHGIDIGDGDGKVIHYCGGPGTRKTGAEIRLTTLDEFANGADICVRVYGDGRATADETIERAMSKLGQADYSLIWNNCEHFATWCITSKRSSRQVTGAIAGAIAGASVAGAASAGLRATALTLTYAGSVAGTSAAGIFSALATTGALVGGGVVAGVCMLGAAPGLVSAGTMNLALKDDENLPDGERAARRVGRYASVAGAAGGSAAGAFAISTLGTAGVSAVGISTGLAAMGGVVGGGMAAGVAVAAAAPAVAAAALGYGAYRGIRAITSRRRPPPDSGTGTRGS